jgi:Tol biopolymer transport system component
VHHDEGEAREQAQLRIGLCYEKLGSKTIQQAREAFQKVLDNYPAQSKEVTVAREKLMGLERARSEIEEKGDTIRIRKIYTIKEDGRVVSPNGRYVASIDWDNICVKVHDMQTGKSWPVSEKGGWEEPGRFPDYPIWHPKSKQLAYWWYIEDKAEFRIVNLHGTETRVLKSGAIEELVWPEDWSRDGKYILGAKRKVIQKKPLKYDYDIALLTVADGSVKIIKSQNGRSCNTYRLAPDNSYLLCDLQPSPDVKPLDIFKIDIATGAETRLVNHPAADWNPFLSPDGDYLIFLSNRTGSRGLWALSMKDGQADGEPFQLKVVLGNGSVVYEITDDGALIFGQGIPSRNVKIATLDFNNGKVISDPKVLPKRFEGLNFMPFWSPDGKHLAYGSYREEGDWRKKMLFVIYDLETEEETELQTDLMMAGAWQSQRARWSPDGKSLLVLGGSRRRGVTGFYLFDIKTGKRTPLLEKEFEQGEEIVGVRPELAPDGNTIYYLQWDGYKRILMKYVISSAEKSILHESEKGISYTVLSPDGNYLAFMHSDKPNELWIIPTDGGEARHIGSLDEGQLIKYPEWTPDSRQVIAYAWEPKDLYSFPVDGGKPTKLNLKLEDGLHLSIHPDGMRIAFTHRPRKGGDIYIMENFLPKTKNKK